MWGLSDPVTVAVISGFTALIGVALRVFFSGQGYKADRKTAIHQEMARPQTVAELRQADALEKIADSAGRIERHLDMITRQKT